MNKIYLKIRNAALVAAVAAAGTSVADAYTAEDLCGKIVGQVFFQNGTLGSGLPSANNDGEFTKQGNYLVLSRFRDSKDVKFELVNGTKLRLVKGSYQNIDDNAYTQIKTARLNSTYDSYYGETYYCFDLTSSSNWEGTISEVGDGLGTLKVTFQGNASSNLLQFRGQSSWGVNLETMNDNLHTYDKVEFFIYPYNATMTTTDGDGNTYTTNLMVATTTPENNKSQILIRN